MKLTKESFVDTFYNPEIFLSMSLAQRSSFLIVLRQQKLLPRFAHLCEQSQLLEGLDSASKRHLKNSLKVAQRLKSQVVEEAIQLDAVLSKESDFVVFLKGAAYSLSNREVGKGRIYSDIDILVNKKQIKQCEQALAIEGWLGQEITDYDDKYYRLWAHEIPPLVHIQRGTVIDVHHNIIPIISNDAPSVSSLASHIIVNEHGLQVLSFAAQFVHSAVHLFRNEDYLTAFRDIHDLYLMLVDAPDDFCAKVIEAAEDLGFVYEVGLAFYFVDKLFTHSVFKDKNNNIESSSITACLNNRSGLRQRFDKYVFDKVLRPQHTLLHKSQTPLMHLLAVIRGHIIKMPLHLLCYHLTIKAGRSMIEALLGKHIFAPKDELSEQRKY